MEAVELSQCVMRRGRCCAVLGGGSDRSWAVTTFFSRALLACHSRAFVPPLTSCGQKLDCAEKFPSSHYFNTTSVSPCLGLATFRLFIVAHTL